MNMDYVFTVKTKLYIVAACAHIFSPRSLETTRLGKLKIYQRDDLKSRGILTTTLSGVEITTYMYCNNMCKNITFPLDNEKSKKTTTKCTAFKK